MPRLMLYGVLLHMWSSGGQGGVMDVMTCCVFAYHHAHAPACIEAVSCSVKSSSLYQTLSIKRMRFQIWEGSKLRSTY